MKKLKTISAAVIIVLSCLYPAYGQEGIPLGRAAQRGLVKVRASAAGGYSSMNLTIVNTQTEDVEVDLFGARFIPPSSSVQPLGVPRVRREGGGSTVALAARQVWKGRCPSLCLKGSASGPRSGLKYRLSHMLVEPNVQAVFKYWNENPRLPQSHVQSVVWGRTVESLARQPRQLPVPVEPPDPYARPKHPYVVLLGGIDYVLGTDGKITREDHLSTEVHTKVLGENFYRIYHCRRKLYGIRKKNDTSAYHLCHKDDGEWKAMDNIYEVPEQVGTFPDGRLVFVSKGKVFTTDDDDASLIRVPVQSVSCGVLAGRLMTSFLSSQGRIISINPLTGAAGYTSDTHLYKYFGVGEELVAAHTGSRLSWQRTAQPLRYKNFPKKIKRVFMAGKRMALFCDDYVWYLDTSNIWFRGQSVQANIADAALDETTGDVHVVDSAGKLQIYRMSEVRNHTPAR